MLNDWLRLLLVASLLASTQAVAQSASKPSEPRGELLYSTYCIACHTSEVHWRDKKLATDWTSLKAQVRRWQANAGAGWSESDIVEVTRHLNVRYYHFQQADSQASLAKAPPTSKM